MSPLFFADRVLEISSGTGLDALQLDGAIAGFRRFSDVAPGDQLFAYVISGDGTNPQWEVGQGQLQVTQDASYLLRNADHSSDGAGACDFYAGQKTVALIASARWHNAVQQPEPPPQFVPDIQQPEFQNGWGDFAAWAAPVSYYRSGFGRVYIDGNISGGTGGNNVVLFKMPPAMRPVANTFFTVRNAGSQDVLGVYVRSNGDVVLQSGTPSWFSLSGINYLAHGA